jgi:hypothetical protein
MIPPRVAQILNYHLFNQRGKDVTEIEQQIFQGIWQNQGYDAISNLSACGGWLPSYFKNSRRRRGKKSPSKIFR